MLLLDHELLRRVEQNREHNLKCLQPLEHFDDVQLFADLVLSPLHEVVSFEPRIVLQPRLTTADAAEQVIDRLLKGVLKPLSVDD